MKVRSIMATLDVLFMFVTGILLWQPLHTPWELFRIIQPLHIFGSLVVTLFFLFPFLFEHIRSSVTFHTKSTSGILFGLTLLVLLVSGIYLLFFGNTGTTAGLIMHTLHLYGSFFLVGLLLWHIRKIFLPHTYAAVTLLLLLPWPLHAGEKMSNIELEQGVSRYHVGDWTNSTTCKECHPEIFKQWANSNHRHMADGNPYYMVLENLAEMDRGVEFRQWCMGCHNPSAVTTKHERTTHFMDENIMPDPLFVKDSLNLQKTFKERPYRLEQGVSCVGCHSITKATSKGNSSFSLGLAKRKRYLFEGENSKVKRWITNRLINANPQTHKEEYMRPLYKKSELCASCHDEFLPHSGRKVVTTFKQWQHSPYNDPKHPKKHKECIDCHMTYMQDGKFAPLTGRSTTGGALKKDIKVHYFAGGNHFLSGLKSKENESQSLQLLRTSAKLDASVKNDKLLIGVTNTGAGHKLPTGAADFRQLWLDVTLTDANGKTLISSGKLDKHGNLQQDSVIFNKVFGDKNGTPVGLFFWRYEKLLKDTRIPAGKRVVNAFNIPKDAKHPLHLTLHLRYRIYPQWVTDIVKAAYPALTDPPAVSIAELEKDFE